MKKSLFCISLLSALLSGQALADSAPKIGSDWTAAAENVTPAFTQAAKESETPALNYVNQPPMIPHSVDKYQITKNVNQCMNCHSPEASRVTGAVRISPTHYIDRDGKVSSQPAPNRHFCLQCHVSQSDVEPIIENEFKPMDGYGSK